MTMRELSLLARYKLLKISFSKEIEEYDLRFLIKQSIW